jgi:hypothetical protein
LEPGSCPTTRFVTGELVLFTNTEKEMFLPGKFCRFNELIVKSPFARVLACFKIPSVVNAVTMNGPVEPAPTTLPEMDVSLLERGVVTHTSGPF